MNTLIVIPAYNEEENIEALVNDVKKYQIDYLIINDCSKDNTSKILDDNGFNHLDLPINLGIAGVTRLGFSYAHDHGYDCAICIDGDGQHLPSYMESLVKEIENGFDYVIGSRFLDKKKPWSMRMIGSRILCFLIFLKTGKKVHDPTSGMRALGKRVIDEFDKSMNFYAEPDALCYLLNHKYNVKEVQVEMKEREAGVSYFTNPFKSIYYMLCEILSIIFIQ
ncbi:MAG: glycosyltransferase family 2 protein [Erysipelotrichaceae bacterium]|nr:glycosyltransferase family 2 protein [Erysipelotrichaceae bacterium]